MRQKRQNSKGYAEVCRYNLRFFCTHMQYDPQYYALRVSTLVLFITRVRSKQGNVIGVGLYKNNVLYFTYIHVLSV